MTSFGIAFFILYCCRFFGESRLSFRTPSTGATDLTQGIFVDLLFPFILTVYQTLSTKLTTKASSSTLVLSESEQGLRIFIETINFGLEIFATHTIIFVFALLFVKAVSLVLAVVFHFPENKLIVASSWNHVAFVRAIGFWFGKRRRKPPDKLQSIAIRPNPTYPVLKWSLLLFCYDVKRGRKAGCTIQCPAAAVRSAAPANQITQTSRSRRTSTTIQRSVATAFLLLISLTVVTLGNHHAQCCVSESLPVECYFSLGLERLPVESNLTLAQQLQKCLTATQLPVESRFILVLASAVIQCAAQFNINLGCCGFEILPVERYFALGFEPWPVEDYFTFNQCLENIIFRGRRPATQLLNEAIACAFRRLHLWLRGSMRIIPSIWIGSFGFQYSCLGSCDFQSGFTFMRAALFEQTYELVSESRTFILVLFLTGTVGEGDVPYCRISVRNIIGSRIEACLNDFVQALSGAPTAVHLLLAIDPFALESGRQRCQRNDVIEAINNSWEYHINGLAELSKLLMIPLCLREDPQLRLVNVAMQKSRSLLMILLN